MGFLCFSGESLTQVPSGECVFSRLLEQILDQETNKSDSASKI